MIQGIVSFPGTSQTERVRHSRGGGYSKFVVDEKPWSTEVAYAARFAEQARNGRGEEEMNRTAQPWMLLEVSADTVNDDTPKTLLELEDATAAVWAEKSIRPQERKKDAQSST